MQTYVDEVAKERSIVSKRQRNNTLNKSNNNKDAQLNLTCRLRISKRPSWAVRI